MKTEREWVCLGPGFWHYYGDDLIRPNMTVFDRGKALGIVRAVGTVDPGMDGVRGCKEVWIDPLGKG